MRGTGRIGVVFVVVAGLVPGAGFGGVAWADGGAEHQVEQARPIALGTSGGNINDRSMLYCCSGTLGALVEDADGQYILSNNHVLGLSNQAVVGDPVTQPGMIDHSPVCAQDTADTVATFTEYVTIKFGKGNSKPLNQADAAIAQVVPGAVQTDGSVLDIGPLSGATVSALPGQVVQKSGRTTGHTFGVVAAVNVTVDVGYSKECGGAANQVARFNNQVRITDGAFSAGGDSGSLIVEADAVDAATGLPRAVGLLFAGNSSSTIANPIDAVLAGLGVSLVGSAPVAPGPTGSIAGVVTSAVDATPVANAAVSVDTGQSATTGADGSYSIVDVPVGDRTVSAAAVGYESQSANVSVTDGATATADFALAEAVLPAGSSVACVTYDATGGKDNSKHLLISISVVDDLGNPLSGAEVQIAVTRDGQDWASGTGAITNAAGVASYTAKNAADGVYETTVTAVIAGVPFNGVTPANLFRKGVDPTPDADCAGDAAQPSAARSGATARLRASVAHAAAIKARNEAALLALDGVVGTGVGADAAGNAVIEVYLGAEGPARGGVPAALDGVATRVIVTGPFAAY